MTRRVWFARDCWLSADPRVEQLAARHGPAGILAFEEILALAKLAEERGVVTIAYAALARRAWLKGAAQAKAIVASMVDFGLVLSDDLGPQGATLEIPRWARWQVSDPTAAERQSRRRARDSHAEVTALERDNAVTNHRDVTPLQVVQKTKTELPTGGAMSESAETSRDQTEIDAA